MKISSKNRRAPNNWKRLILLSAMVGVLWVLVWNFSSQLPELEKRFKQGPGNVSVFLFDRSIQEVDPSIKIWINGDLFYEGEYMSLGAADSLSIHLNSGWHQIRVSTLEGLYITTDSIEIQNNNSPEILQIVFDYNPPANDYVELATEYIYQKKLGDKELSEKDKEVLRHSIRESIETEMSENMSYRETQPHFTISLEKRLLL